MSCVNLDGSHTRAFRGGQSVGYNGRKGHKSTNMLFLIDSQGVILFCSLPISGEHHDLFEVRDRFGEIVDMAKECGIELRYLFMNADAGFDGKVFRGYLEALFIEANIDFNKRNEFRPGQGGVLRWGTVQKKEKLRTLICMDGCIQSPVD